jgi:hypothetical protein
MGTSSVIFSGSTGLVLAVPNSGARKVFPGKIRVAGFEPVAALISGVNYDQSVNVQFQSALGRGVYVYVFGDNMGTVKVDGIAFQGMCGNEGKSGIGEILEYYSEKRASQSSDVMTVTIGDVIIVGFLVSSSIRNITAATDEAAAFSQYSLSIATLPRE